MAGLREFGRNMKRHGENVEKNASALVRKCALAIDAAVVIGTPVDSGRARGNWQVQLNGPASGTLEVEDKSGAGAISQGKGVIAGHQPGGSIHITNNLAYIGRLNDGYSAQAPAGFVQKAVLIGLAAVRGAKGIITGNLRDGE